MLAITLNVKDDYINTFSAIMHLALDDTILIKTHITMTFINNP